MPDAPLRWTSKSTRKLAAELQAMGHRASHSLVGDLLHELGYTLQAHRKSREGTQHPDRDAQFHYLNEQVQQAQQRGEPAISVDAKKKELVGDFKNPGREWRPKGTPERVRVHDFIIPEQGKAIPYGIYDLTRDEGWVSVGIDHDTASFAMNAIRSWWQKMGRPAYAGASHLLITADAGGSNGPKTRLWKWELQRFANRTGLTITVCHYPPGTSKWNKIEHRLFSHIAMKLARQSADQSGRDRESHRRYNDDHRIAHPLRDRQAPPIRKGCRSATRKWTKSTWSHMNSMTTGTTRFIKPKPRGFDHLFRSKSLAADGSLTVLSFQRRACVAYHSCGLNVGTT